MDRAYRRAFGDAMWTHPVMPPPVRFERHAFRSPESGGVEGGGVSATSCGSAEDSPHGGYHAGYLRRSGGGQTDPGSVSEPCQSEAYSRGTDKYIPNDNEKLVCQDFVLNKRRTSPGCV